MSSLPWFMNGLINNYGMPDPYGGFPKPDMNVDVPAGDPITALFSGVVSGINDPSGGVPSWGNVITIKMDNPYNSVATHTAYLHLASIAPGLKVGDRISAGQIVGYSGGTNPGPGLQNASVGFAFYNGDYYGFGPTWTKYNGSPLLDPTKLFNDLQSGNFVVGTSYQNTNPIPVQDLLNALGLPTPDDVKNFFEQFGLIVFGFLLLIVGIMVVFFSSDTGKKTTEVAAEAAIA